MDLMLTTVQQLRTIFRHAPVAALGFAMSLGLESVVNAQSMPELTSPSFAPTHVAQNERSKNAAKDASRLDAIRERDQQLEAIRTQQKQSAENETALKREITAIGDDRRKLNQALIDTATRLRNLEGRIALAENRLASLEGDELLMREKLAGRRNLISEVLAALQRIGRHPPPAVMVTAEDALTSVRTAIMLGAVLPEMRGQAEKLAADLAGLVNVRKNITEEQERLLRDLAALAGERARTARLIDERQKKQTEAEKALEAERTMVAGLARQADNLKDLIGRLEHGLDRASRTSRAIENQRNNDNRPEMAAFKDPGRLAPAVAFAGLRGQLLLPVNGVRSREFGAPDAIGGSEKGLSITTKAGAQVTSPCDGWVVYASPFRNYGQVLILDAGAGYHVVLSGMDRISVGVGQFVLTGEPVAIMGNGSQMATSATISPNQSVLYVEFRKDGTPIDPSPWWATSEGEKVRG